MRSALKFDDREAFAAALGISRAALAYYERGERVPDASVLALYHDIFRVNLIWLVTGSGGMWDNALGELRDFSLVELMFDRAQAIFDQVGQTVPPRRLAHEAVKLQARIEQMVTDTTDLEMVRAALPAAELELKRRLLEANAAPGTGKRSAS